MKEIKDMTYSEAIAEIEQILRAMQGDQCDIDKLAAMTKRATELIDSCRARLTATDEELRTILATLSN
ncbi:MAG: exodeoxyribonuclease VII small subunit [Muribaculaceae bacterium]|nr:exodeoxyribonuclease VII small subunit [Muribaculaceae bacterium]